MSSVTQRIKAYNRDHGQPRGGFVNPRVFVTTALDDGIEELDHRIENLAAPTVGSAVDYLSRLARVRVQPEDVTEELLEVFHVSLTGAERIAVSTRHTSVLGDAVDALSELSVIEHPDGTVTFDVDDVAVRVACKLVTYDVGRRAGPGLYEPVSTLQQPDPVTTEHILQMVRRAVSFFDEWGPVTADGFVFADADTPRVYDERSCFGGYTELVTSGDGDFLTADTVWDMKVSVNPPTKDHTLQLLMYFLMGKESRLDQFESQTHVGVFNPRLNKVFRLAVADIAPDVIDTVRRDVIGYRHELAATDPHGWALR
ncbi:hypothetical protein [Microbacterium sp. NIBRBAC000506063]|uniref:hypothetical protein n=1 Tax=Microbacterium sp. NIBRBAC000506063 TaxID=2734618 RepID=UPI001BB48FA1|nr:hypothetical protein [Microbacterium sp. NIBRBAC000506063]QTV80766.1 hypothetical protein KAE78_15035 [Microbacterium sp. NIBRBAC000506063]